MGLTTIDLILRMGRLLREARGLPEEKNIGELYNKTALELGLAPMMLVTNKSLTPEQRITPGHVPGYTMPRPMSTPAMIPVPKRDCPQCGKKEALNLGPICGSCADSESGKYITMWFCGDMDDYRRPVPGTGCGFKEKHRKGWGAWLDELKVDWKSGFKKDMVKTYTDEGLK